jgi:hypothetical protein
LPPPPGLCGCRLFNKAIVAHANVAETGDTHGMVSSSHMWMMVVTLERHNEWAHPCLTKAVAEAAVLRYRTKLSTCTTPHYGRSPA